MSYTPEPLPEPVAWFRAPYGTLEPNPLFRAEGPRSLELAIACFTEYQLRAHAAAEVARAVAAERERCDVDRLNSERLDLALMVYRLIRRMRAARAGEGSLAGDETMAEKAIDYLRRKGLESSPYRSEAEGVRAHPQLLQVKGE